MRSNILHKSGLISTDGISNREAANTAVSLVDGATTEDKNPFLVALGKRVGALRARRGLTRKAVAIAADVSERHLANLSTGWATLRYWYCSRWLERFNALWPKSLVTAPPPRPSG